jgi:hypothetical protein
MIQDGGYILWADVSSKDHSDPNNKMFHIINFNNQLHLWWISEPRAVYRVAYENLNVPVAKTHTGDKFTGKQVINIIENCQIHNYNYIGKRV